MKSSTEIEEEREERTGYGRLLRLEDVDTSTGPPYARYIDRMSVQQVLLEIGKAIIEEVAPR